MAASLAGEKIIMQSATLLMIPEPSAFTFVTAEEHCAGAGALDKTTEVICRGPRPRDGASGPKGCGLSEGVDPADSRGGGAFLVFIRDAIPTCPLPNPQMRCTKGGMNTKLHAVADADGRPIRFFMTAGQVSDYMGAAAPLGSLPKAEWLLADRGYDADWFREALKDKGIKPCIPGRKSRGKPIKYDKRR